ncbi:MAG: sialate O-acetylesterase [Porcipelethomonas sp.]
MIKPAAIFSDNMVLQRGKNINIFGSCDSERIFVSFRRNTVEAEISDGKWNAVLPPSEAGGPFELEISDGNDKICYKNVMTGEVWLAGGQSNMEFELQNALGGKEILETLSEDNTNVRFYYTTKLGFIDEKFYEAEKRSCWETADSKEAGKWSAVGFYFARLLSEKLGVTVGIIGCNLGGTSASAWTSRKYLSGIDEFSSYLDEYDKAVAGKSYDELIKEYDEYTEYDSAWFQKMQKCYEEDPEMPWSEVIEICGENKWPGPLGPKNPFRPCGLFETMISRIAPYTIKGVLYYQGESDDHKPDSYYMLLSRLISCWREEWKDDTLPFMLVQLPMFRYKDDEDRKHWCIIREAQMKAYRTIKNTGIAVISDCGELGNIHPVNKKPVGERLYLQAMHHVYGEDVRAFGPIYKDHICTNGKIELEFYYAENGFEVKGKADGFEIAGSDKKFVKADVKISESRIILSSPEVKKPLYARYAWTNYMEVSVFNETGIPLAPFRTYSE